MKHSPPTFKPSARVSLLTISTLILLLTGCLDDVKEQIAAQLLKIDASNAEQVASTALDMAEAVDDADDVLDAVVGTGTVNETVPCNDPALDPSGSGSATVTGTDSGSGKDFTVTYNDCTMNGYALNGSLHIMSSTTANVKSGTTTGNLSVTFNGETFTLSNISVAFTKDDITKDYSNDFGMTLSTSALPGGSISIDTTTPFAGNELTIPNNPSTGVMVVTGSQNTKVRLTANDNTNYSLNADTDGDDVYDTQITNQADGTNLFSW